jgi:hypothetical protein
MTTPIVYIGGASRSGSTLLESILAVLPGCVSIGEAVFIWERGVVRNDRCACGAPFRECPFWSAVGAAAFGSWDRPPASDGARLRRTVDRHRNLHRLALMRPGSLEADLVAYRQLTEQLYAAVAEVSGATVLVDSSKHVAYARVLNGVTGFDLRLVHLVREPHGVAHSWSRKVRKPAVGDGTEYMSVHPTSWAVNRWVADNLAFELLRRLTPSALLRYEDLVRRPVAELERVCRDVGLESLAAEASSLDPAAIPVRRTHAISGNPARAGDGVLRLVADDEWRREMSLVSRAGVTVATWPLLLRYRYLGASGGAT